MPIVCFDEEETAFLVGFDDAGNFVLAATPVGGSAVNANVGGIGR